MYDVLLLDDDELLRQLISDALRDVGVRTIAMPTVHDAADALACHPECRVLIVDHDLGPGDLSSGFAFGRAALARSPRYGIIYMTAQWRNYERYPPGPQERHLPKPFRLAELLLVVRDLLGRLSKTDMRPESPAATEKRRELGRSWT